MPTTKASQRAVHKYVKANYDRMELIVPKGQRDSIRAFAESNGESVNGFVQRAVREAMSGTREEAPAAQASGFHDPAMIEHIEKTKETEAEFIARAVRETIERDKMLMAMGLPAIKKNPEA